jgi:hypothetical protein
VSSKHAKLLRKARLRYMASIINNTPEGMKAELSRVVQSADCLMGIVVKMWPKFNHIKRGKSAALLSTMHLSDAVARMLNA